MKNHLIAICSGTKGIGKTWFAVNLSLALGLLKQKVLFFDADCGVDNIAYQINFDIKKSYTSLLKGSVTINNNVFKYDKGFFDIICSKSGENILSSAPVGRVQILAKDLFCFSKNYNYVVVDCSDDYVKNVNAFINICNTVFIIVNADPMSSEGAYKKIAKIKKINPKADIKIIINRAISYNEGNQIYKNLLKAAQTYIKTDLNLLGIIRQDTRIRDCVLNKSLLLNRYIASEGAEDMIKISQKILEEM